MMLLLLLYYSWMLLLLSLRRRKRRWSVILACPQLIGDELPHYFARQVFDHGLVHDAVVLDDGRHGAVLALVTARGLRAAEGRAGRDLSQQLGLVMALGEVAVEVTLGLAHVLTAATLDVEGAGHARVGGLEELLASVVRLGRGRSSFARELLLLQLLLLS